MTGMSDSFHFIACLPQGRMSSTLPINWLRLLCAVEGHVKTAIVDVVHNFHNDPNYTGFPIDTGKQYQEMDKFRKGFEGKLKFVKKSQWDELCPPAKKDVSVYDWDLTKAVIVIEHWLTPNFKFPAPLGGWERKTLMLGDISKAAFIVRARIMRNEIIHGNKDELASIRFTSVWGDIRDILVGLDYDPIKLARFDDLKTKFFINDLPNQTEEISISHDRIRVGDRELIINPYLTSNLTHNDNNNSWTNWIFDSIYNIYCYFYSNLTAIISYVLRIPSSLSLT